MFTFQYFEGSRKIEGLPVYPFENHGNEESRRMFKEDLIARGQRWAQIVSGKSSYWMHEGLYVQGEGVGQDNWRERHESENKRSGISHVRSHVPAILSISS